MKIARASNQLQLLSVAPEYIITDNARARNAYGAAAQEIVCAALRLRQIAIDGSCETCFDAEDESGGFWEIKSVKRGARVVVYSFRMEKEERAGVPLTYGILCHGIRGCRDGRELFALMSKKGVEILAIPAAEVHRLARLEPLRTIKTERATKSGKRNGYTREGYSRGYHNLPVKKLSEQCRETRREAFELFGTQFEIAIHEHNSLRR